LLFLFALLSVGQRTVAQVTVAPSISTVAGNGASGSSGDGSAATSAKLYNPYGVAVDSAGNIYISDTGSNRIRKVDTSGEISTVAGVWVNGYRGDGGPATWAELSHPDGVAVDSAGNIYIADEYNNCIRKVDTSGTISTVAGNGTHGSSGDGSAATSAKLDQPYGVAVDRAGNIYIADTWNNRIRKVDASGNISTVAGNGTGGYSGDGGLATSAEIYHPDGVAVDSAGNIYFADPYNFVIRKVDASTGKISTVAGNGTEGYSGDGGAATSAKLDYPYGVVVDSAGNIYIADQVNNRIRKVDTSGNISTVAGNGTEGYSGDGAAATSAELYKPQGVAVDSAGNIYIVDTDNNRIRKVDAAAIQVAATAIGSSTTKNVLLQLTSLLSITGIAAPQSQGGKQEYAVGTVSGCTVDATGATSTASGTICTVPVTFTPGYSGLRPVPLQVSTLSGSTTIVYPVGLNGIGTGPQVALTPGTISTVAGNGTKGSSGDGGAVTSAEIRGTGVTVDSAGNIYFADNYNNSILKMDTSGNTSTVAGNGTYGYSGDGSAATSAELDYPSGVAVDSAGNIYIADTGNNRIRKVDTSGNISTVAGNGTEGYSGDGVAATSAELYQPRGVAVDSAGNIYIADTWNHRIRKVNTSGNISTVAGSGNAGYSGEGSSATSMELYEPEGVAVDSAGNIYIADTLNQRIRKVDVSTGSISTVAGNGNSNGSAVTIIVTDGGIVDIVCGGYSGDGDAAVFAELNSPLGVTVDSAGNIYIADTTNDRIRKVDASTGNINTVAGNGTGGYSGDGSAATSAKLGYPWGVAVDSAGNIYISDSSNLIRKVDVSASSLRFATATSVGSTDTTDGPQTATISNIGNSALTLATPTTGTNPSISMGFALNTAATCPQLSTSSSTSTLASGASCTLAVDFTPTAAGSTSGSVVVTDDALNVASSMQSVSLSGTGLDATATALTASPTTVVLNETVTLTAVVSDTTTTSSTPTGTVTFSYGSTSLGSVSLSGGMASLATTTLPPGTDSITAVYGGNTNFAGSTSTAVRLVVEVANPVPVISSFSPAYSSAGSPAFTLTVNGSTFLANSTVYWGSAALATTYVSSSQLTAQVTASQIATGGIYAITVQTPAPGGGSSSAMQFEVDLASGASTPPTITTVTATVTAGATASYTVTLPSTVTSATVVCLNLPAGATCTYSNGLLTIATSATTPAGVYQITVIFVETVTDTTAAVILLPILLLPLVFLRRRMAARGIWATACLGLVLLAGMACSTGCGGSGGGSGNSGGGSGGGGGTQTHQVTSSIVVTLTVK
jgi:sugar lactone lactonase YvrE